MKTSASKSTPLRQIIRKFLIEFGRRTDWRPKNEQELRSFKILIWSLIGLSAAGIVLIEVFV